MPHCVVRAERDAQVEQICLPLPPIISTAADFLHLIHYLEQFRQHEEARRHRENEIRRPEEQARRKEDDLQRHEAGLMFDLDVGTKSMFLMPPWE